MGERRTVLVLGVTGQQGGATARHLLAGGWHVRGLTRNASSPAARRIEALGVELVEGDMEQPATLEAAMAGVHGVFSVQPPTWDPTPETDAHEARIGRLVADVAREAGVRHFVYASVTGADAITAARPDYKAAVEQHIRALDLPATILRPVTFMENYALPPQGLAAGTFYEPTAPGVRIGLVAVDDIGFFAALAFRAPDRFIGKTVDIAGDFLTPPEVASALGAALGRSVAYRHVPPESLSTPIVAALYEWVNRSGYPEIDVGALRALHPGLLTFEDWLRAGGAKRILAALGATAATDVRA